MGEGVHPEKEAELIISAEKQRPDLLVFWTLLFFLLLMDVILFPYIDNFFTQFIICNIAALAVFSMISLLPLLKNITARFTKITVDASGIQRGRRYIKWEDLKSINISTFSYLMPPMLTLKVDRKKVPFLTLHPSSVSLSFPLELKDWEKIIPLITKYRPDIEIPEKVKNYALHIKRRSTASRVIMYVTAAIQIFLLLMISFSFQNGNSFQLLIYQFMLLDSLFLTQNVIFETEKNSYTLRFLYAVLFSTAIWGSLEIFLFMIMYAPRSIVPVVIYTHISILLFALILLFLKKLKPFTNPFFLFIAMTLIAIANFSIHYKQPIPTDDISSFFEENNDSYLLTWSTNGRYIAYYSSSSKTTKRNIFDVKTKKNISIPTHPGGDRIIWMNDAYILRTTESSENKTEIFIYSFKDKKEYLLDAAENIRISRVASLQPDKNLLLWMTKSKKDDLWQIKIAPLNNLKSHKIEELNITLPNYRWEECRWGKENKIIFIGREQRQNNNCTQLSSLIIFRYDIKTAKGNLYISKQKATSWIPVANSSYAFGKIEHTNSKEIFFLNTVSNQVTSLPGTSYPSWIVDNNYAFRTVIKRGKQQLCRFNIHSASEKEITTVPDNYRLEGISYNGRFAIFAIYNLMSQAIYKVLDMKTIQWYTIDLPGMSMAGGYSNAIVLYNKFFSICSPTENLIVATSYFITPYAEPEKVTKTVFTLIDLNKLEVQQEQK